jgi:hypothetical protein
MICTFPAVRDGYRRWLNRLCDTVVVRFEPVLGGKRCVRGWRGRSRDKESMLTRKGESVRVEY